MQKGTLLFIALVFVCSDPVPATAGDALNLDEHRFIEIRPTEVVCRPADNSADEAETIILKEGEDPRTVCPDGRIILIGFAPPETLTGEPPPSPYNEEGTSP